MLVEIQSTPKAATIDEPPVKTKPEVDSEVLEAIDPNTLDDSYVYVHCHFKNDGGEMLIRIWRSTFLIDRISGARAELLHAENISYAPLWSVVPPRSEYTFLLIFSGLPKDCTSFDLIEDIPQPGGFFVSAIPRNNRDVYHVNI